MFAGAGRKRDIDAWFADEFGAPDSHFTTLNHDLHRERRAAIAPLFSAGSVRKFQPVIEERVDRLLERIREFRDKGEVLDLTLAFPAVTNGLYFFSGIIGQDANVNRHHFSILIRIL